MFQNLQIILECICCRLSITWSCVDASFAGNTNTWDRIYVRLNLGRCWPRRTFLKMYLHVAVEVGESSDNGTSSRNDFWSNTCLDSIADARVVGIEHKIDELAIGQCTESCRVVRFCCWRWERRSTCTKLYPISVPRLYDLCFRFTPSSPSLYIDLRPEISFNSQNQDARSPSTSAVLPTDVWRNFPSTGSDGLSSHAYLGVYSVRVL